MWVLKTQTYTLVRFPSPLFYFTHPSSEHQSGTSKTFLIVVVFISKRLSRGREKKAGKILVYLKTSILLMALGGDLGHSKFGETILLPVTHFFLVCWKGFFVLWPWKNGLTLYITHRRTVTKWVLWMHMVRFEKSFVLVSILSYISSVTEEILYSIKAVSDQGS